MAEKPQQKMEDVPDPDEDDLDDLDDVLDEFQATTISQPTTAAASTTAPSASGPGRPSTGSTSNKDAITNESDEDFAKQLQAGMSSLISELDSNPTMQAEFEKMMQELIAAGAAPTDTEAGDHVVKAAEAIPKVPESTKPTASGKKPAVKKAGGDNFQDTIQRTMARMQASSDEASAKTTSANAQSEEDFLAQLMKEMADGGGDSEGDFNTMLMNMMSQLTNKEILYDPMKELYDKFPAWFEKNESKTAKDEVLRYKEQQKLVGEIVKRFERKGYSDDNEEDRAYIVERMQQMQEQGSPPSDLVGDMSAATEALGDLDAGCPQQ